jgi:hypothetical protein
VTSRPYPNVLSEQETLRFVCEGRSIARYGDGEFRLCNGFAAKAQRPNPALRDRLREILIDVGECLIGIPNIRSATPKAEFWNQYRVASYLLGDWCYASSFITRPDSAPWIDTPEYWAALASLWRDQDLTLVRGSGSSFTAEMLRADGAGNVTEVLAPAEHAFTGRCSIASARHRALCSALDLRRRCWLSISPPKACMR